MSRDGMPRLRNKDGKLLGTDWGESGITYTLAEELEAVSPPKDDWGSWRLDAGTMELICPDYEVDLEQCLTSGEVLDWIIQVAQKAWADDTVIAGLVRALDDVLHPQANLCSNGSQKSVTAAQARELAARAAADRELAERVYGIDAAP